MAFKEKAICNCEILKKKNSSAWEYAYDNKDSEGVLLFVVHREGILSHQTCKISRRELCHFKFKVATCTFFPNLYS